MRRFVALMEGLPAEAASRSKEQWSVSDHLLAMNAEVTHGVYRAVLASIPTKQPKKIPDPLHIPRPGEQPKVARRVTPFELIQTLRR